MKRSPVGTSLVVVDWKSNTRHKQQLYGDNGKTTMNELFSLLLRGQDDGRPSSVPVVTPERNMLRGAIVASMAVEKEQFCLSYSLEEGRRGIEGSYGTSKQLS